MYGANSSAHDIAVRNSDGVTIFYNWIKDGTELAVTYLGNSYSIQTDRYSGQVEIPESVDYDGSTFNVTSIGANAFKGCSGLTSVIIPNSVTYIGMAAFEYCI
jgi:hypothetical protein